MNTKSADNKQTILLVLGMAGSGKSTFTQRVIAEAEEREYDLKSVNLDPAVGGGISQEEEGDGDANTDGEDEEEEGFEGWCHGIPYEPNVDIRDSIDYKKLMKTNELGPNGAIMLSLNMFATRLNDLSAVVEKWRDVNKVDFVCVDTPGQIEVFTWSASGMLFTEMFSRVMPTVLVFVVDTPSMQSASTFVSVLFHACGVMLRTQLPMVLVFNKTDLQSADAQFTWMEDLDALQTALDEESEDTQYMASLSASVSLMMHEFLEAIHVCAVSSVTGEGMDEFFIKVKLAAKEFDEGREEDVVPVEKARAEVKRPFAAPTLEDQVGAAASPPIETEKLKEEEEEEERNPPPPTASGHSKPPKRAHEEEEEEEKEVKAPKSKKELNTEAFLKRKFAEFEDVEGGEPSFKRGPAPPPRAAALTRWHCQNCEMENTGAFCTSCLESSPMLPSWFCHLCGIENTGANCKACLTASPLLVGSTGAASADAAANSTDDVLASPTTTAQRRPSQHAKFPPWSCLSCTFFNTKGGGCCEMCNQSHLWSASQSKLNPSAVWTCVSCELNLAKDTSACPQCGADKPSPVEEKATPPPAAVAAAAAPEFVDGQIVEDMIWSQRDNRFFPLNATRDGKFDETKVKSVPSTEKEEGEEEEEVSYEYDDLGDAREEE